MGLKKFRKSKFKDSDDINLSVICCEYVKEYNAYYNLNCITNHGIHLYEEINQQDCD